MQALVLHVLWMALEGITSLVSAMQVTAQTASSSAAAPGLSIAALVVSAVVGVVVLFSVMR